MTRRPAIPRAQGSGAGSAAPTSGRRPGSPGPRAPRPGPAPRRATGRSPGRAGERGPDRSAEHPSGPSRGAEIARLLSVRALLLGVVLLIAFAMVFPTVRAYLGQRAMLDDLTAQVTAAEAREEQLAAQLDRWQTDAYVIAQARERLSYVMPGETAYRVIDPESVVDPGLTSSAEPGAETGLALPAGGAVAPWYTTIWDSVTIAGEAPVPGDDSVVPPAGTAVEDEGTGGPAAPATDGGDGGAGG